MERRGFLRTTFHGGLAASTAACATSPARQSAAPLDDAELERELRQMDRVVARMDRVSDRWFFGHRERASGAVLALRHRPEPEPSRGEAVDEPRSLADGEQLASEGELLRASMRSIFVTSSLAELPESQHGDPRVVERLRHVSGEADFAVFGTLARLDSLDSQQLDAIDELAKQPDFIDRVLEDIDVLSRDLEVPPKRRLHLRRMAKHLSWKLERQPMSAIIRETVDAVVLELETWSRRLETQQLAFADGDPRWIERTEQVMRMYAPSSGTTPDFAVADPVRVSQIERARLRVKQGQIMLGVGLGLAVLGAGGVIAGVYAVGPLIWVGGVAATIGVILVIVGAVFWGLGNSTLKELHAPR
jgi:hypothetical protein